MPSHIYSRLGDYARAIGVNERAAALIAIYRQRAQRRAMMSYEHDWRVLRSQPERAVAISSPACGLSASNNEAAVGVRPLRGRIFRFSLGFPALRPADEALRLSRPR